MTAYPRLFSPGRIGGLTLRNRIVMASMEKNLAAPTGAVTQRYVDYCEARAAGGAALILLESMYVHPAGRGHRCQLGIHDDALVPGYRGFVETCHRQCIADTKALIRAGRAGGPRAEVAGAERATRTASSIPQPGQSSTAILRW
jgi:2,4-dienoyl-CoA reductase-like NADH-dependent reductase (Old Yellow Enzyme family)